MRPPDLATVTLHALDVAVLMLTRVHGDHDPASCQVCWHVHDELDHVETAMRSAIADGAEPLEAAA